MKTTYLPCVSCHSWKIRMQFVEVWRRFAGLLSDNANYVAAA